MIRKLLALLFLLLPTVAHAEWHEASTPHFVVYSDDKPERLKRFATNLEQFDKALRLYLKMKDPKIGPANRVTVYVVDDLSDVARLYGSNKAAGFYQARAGGSLAFVPRSTGSDEDWNIGAMEILLHEYAHHFMYSMGSEATYPRWFSEGFAEFTATARFPEDGTVTLGHPPQYRSYSVLDATNLTIEELFTADERKLRDSEESTLYGRGWLLTHYLLIGSERRAQLGEYLRAINSGKKGLEPATTAFGDIKALHRELERYKKTRFTAIRVPAEAVVVAEPTIRKLRPGEAATMNVRMLSKRGVDGKTAPGVYEKAKKACAPFPNDPAVQIVLAEAAFDAGDLAAAEAAADRALAADPKAVDALVYKTWSQMAALLKANDKSGAKWNALRRILVQAIEIDMTDPEPLILLYQSYVNNEQAPTETAQDALLLAFHLAPYDGGLRLNTARLHMTRGNKNEARKLLEVLAFAPHGQGYAVEANKMLEELDRGPPATETEKAKTGTASSRP